MNALLIANEKKKTVKLENEEEFEITAVFPKEKVEIAVKMGYLQNGLPADSFSLSDKIHIEKIATIDVCVLDKPEKYDEWSSCLDWDDPTIIDELFNHIQKHTEKIDKSLKKNKSTNRGT
jgi:hypothetical protein